MKAIVVISVQAHDVEVRAGQSLAISTNASLRDGPALGSDQANRADNLTIHNESAPPFWTWFIENPRPLEILP
jgi:hypothetical protein